MLLVVLLTFKQGDLMKEMYLNIANLISRLPVNQQAAEPLLLVPHI